MAEGAANEDVLLATTESLPGYDVAEYVMLVGGSDADPGRALGRLADHARELGADAVLAIRMTTAATGGAFVSDRETFAFGTAVLLRAR